MRKFDLNMSTAVFSGAEGAGIGSPSGLEYISPTQDGLAPNGKEYLTLDEAVANLTRTGGQWKVGGNGVITYSFLEQAPNGLYNNPHETYLASLTQQFSPFTTEQRDAAREAIGLWDDLIAPRFVEKNGHGGGADINFMNTGEGGPGQAAAFVPDFHGRYNKINGDLYVDALQPDNFDLGYGGYGETTIVHEIGHTIGLSHTGEYDASDDQAPTYANSAKFFQDSYQYSIMSYFNAGNTGAGYINWATGYAQTPQTPMVHDIAAVQALYGADLTTRTGNTTYGFNSTADRDVFDFTKNKTPFLTIYDAGGHDTLDLSGFTGGAIVLDLRPGAFSTGYNYGDAATNNAVGWSFGPQTQQVWNLIYDGKTNVPMYISQNIGIAYNTTIEDGRTGAQNDILIGNDVANRLDGGKGNDTFTGNGGNDIFVFNDIGGADSITDFTRGQDKIDLSGIDAIAGTGKNDAFTFLGDGAFTGHAGELHTQQSGSNWILLGDVNGDGRADFSINLGTAHVTSSDLFL